MSKNIKWEGTVTALSSISHGSEALGTVTYLRREKMFISDGTLEEVPVISGNAWRGIMRDIAADLWWKEVGEPKLTLPVMHALWSGGALAKLSGPTLSGGRLQELKNICPVVGVFGTAGGGRIISGSLQVGKLIPICEETKHIIPKEYHLANMPSLWDITQIEYYSRIPNNFDTEETEETSRLARYGVETLAAGTKFYTWCSLTWATDLEVSFFQNVLSKYSLDASVGGLFRAGHGNISFDLTNNLVDVPNVDWKEEVQKTDPMRRLEVLSWLD